MYVYARARKPSEYIEGLTSQRNVTDACTTFSGIIAATRRTIGSDFGERCGVVRTESPENGKRGPTDGPANERERRAVRNSPLTRVGIRSTSERIDDTNLELTLIPRLSADSDACPNDGNAKQRETLPEKNLLGVTCR